MPRQIKNILGEYYCKTAQEVGWGSYENGELLSLAEKEFDVFITADQNIAYQQNLKGRTMKIIVLSSNDLRRIQNSAEMIRRTVTQTGQGEYIEIELHV
ncbi:MAG: hypothetical protein FJ218_00945 [Ignavibacteria bacterium]|nr:hypothetical protein [Ignavibacteria bacterium]